MTSRFEQDWKVLRHLDSPATEQLRVVRKIAKGDVTTVFPMIVKFATSSWERLPPHTRAWYTKEEMIAAGVAYTSMHVAKEFLKTYNKKKAKKVTFATKTVLKVVDDEVVKTQWKGCGSSFSSYLYLLLQRFYITIVTEPLRAKERWEGGTISLSTDYVKVGRLYTSAEFYIAHTMKQSSPENEVIAKVDAEKHFLLVYSTATPNLRKYLLRWFLTSKPIRMKDGEEYRAAKREFRKLSVAHNFTVDMAIFLAGNDNARASAALAVISSFRTGAPELKRCMEREAIQTAVMASV